MTYAELERFFEDLIDRLRHRGVPCAITSGMACVHFGVAVTTKDCDALCTPEAADRFLAVLGETRLGGVLPSYAGDPRGWLHIFDFELLLDLLEKVPLPRDIATRRPSLELALLRDPRLRQVLRVEREFWEELDRARLKVYERALRPYAAAVRKSKISSEASLDDQHRIRVTCAKQRLALTPLRDHGLDRLIEEARAEIAKLFAPDLLHWLPDARDGFKLLLS